MTAHSSRLIHPFEAPLALAGVRPRARTGYVSDPSTEAPQSRVPSVDRPSELTGKRGNGTDATQEKPRRGKRTLANKAGDELAGVVMSHVMEDSPPDSGDGLSKPPKPLCC